MYRIIIQSSYFMPMVFPLFCYIQTLAFKTEAVVVN